MTRDEKIKKRKKRSELRYQKNIERKKMAKTREQKRIESADKVCRELRYQIVKYGLIGDWEALNKHFDSWMNNAKQSKYDRP